MEHKVAGSGHIVHLVRHLCLKLLLSSTHPTVLFDTLVQLDRQAAREQEELAESEAPPPAGALSFSRVSGLQRYYLHTPMS